MRVYLQSNAPIRLDYFFLFACVVCVSAYLINILYIGLNKYFLIPSSALNLKFNFQVEMAYETPYIIQSIA